MKNKWYSTTIASMAKIRIEGFHWGNVNNNNKNRKNQIIGFIEMMIHRDDLFFPFFHPGAN